MREKRQQSFYLINFDIREDYIYICLEREQEQNGGFSQGEMIANSL